MKNIYVHFPFCRRKCTYCALHSRIGQNEKVKKSYFLQVIAELRRCIIDEKQQISTIYFGGGTPILAILATESWRESGGEIWECLKKPGIEFTVELHPSDVSEAVLRRLKAMGVNRISMGVQSLDDGVLKSMGRGYTANEAVEKFRLVKRYFDNAGIDLIVGYPDAVGVCPQGAEGVCPQGGEGVCPQGGDGVCPQRGEGGEKWARLREFKGLRHCSVYSLILEEKSLLWKLCRDGKVVVPSDDEALDELLKVGGILGEMGLERYEISSWAMKGFECRHNSAVWEGEDYVGIGDGAYGREGRKRTHGVADSGSGWRIEVEEVGEEADRKERRLFQLRTRRGMSVGGFAAWLPKLERFEAEGLLAKTQDGRYRLTARGTEVADTVLAELV